MLEGRLLTAQLEKLVRDNRTQIIECPICQGDRLDPDADLYGYWVTCRGCNGFGQILSRKVATP